MKGDRSMTMMTLSELWKQFKLLSDPQDLSDADRTFLQRFLSEEQKLRERKRIEHLLRQSGIKRVKLLKDFDWTFNPKISRDKIMEFLQTQWLKKPSNLVIIGPAGVGKTHIASALCHEAILKGYQTVFLSLFDLSTKLAKAKSLYNLIEYYGRIPVLCLDELGYVIPTKEQADCIFQIFSKRTEVTTTLVTTNLVPSDWGKIFDTVTASAILDRLSLNGKFITFEGRSYRSKK
jgi:DNA replication protein DnaC